jgi:2-oxoglutarate ferredoxin oxidoreductase subunit delta
MAGMLKGRPCPSRGAGHFRGIATSRNVAMAGRIVIDTERCKGCGLCITVCPKNSIVLSKESNRNGYFPAEAKDGECTACTRCAIVCPEGIIEVFLEQGDRVRIVATAGKKDTPHTIEEKR